MSLRGLRVGEMLAGVSGVALLVAMVLEWYDVEGVYTRGAPAGAVVDAVSRTAWEAFAVVDLVLAAAALMGIALLVVTAIHRSVAIAVALNALVALAGIVTTVLVLVRIGFPPSPDVDDLPGAIDVADSTRSIGAYLGLAACAGLAAGGWLAMRDEGSREREGTVVGDNAWTAEAVPLRTLPAPPREGVGASTGSTADARADGAAAPGDAEPGA